MALAHSPDGNRHHRHDANQHPARETARGRFFKKIGLEVFVRILLDLLLIDVINFSLFLK